MWKKSIGLHCSRITYRESSFTRFQYRSLLTLAIETSCDDTSVAILDRPEIAQASLLFHKRITADNSANRGIHPLVALASHQQNLAKLVAEALHELPVFIDKCHSRCIKIRDSKGELVPKRLPDFVSVTRGPGIHGALTTGLDTAKGLSVAWQIPMVGINHMQAHTLTPRLVDALKTSLEQRNEVAPRFPFVTVLASGGHTMVVHSTGLCEHRILASTVDIAIGDAIDKMARCILPEDIISGQDVSYGRLLEEYCFQDREMLYQAPKDRLEAITPRVSEWGWSLPVPFREAKTMAFSFSGLQSRATTISADRGPVMAEGERRAFGQDCMRVAFEHLASRVVFALQDLQRNAVKIPALVMSGGVASNRYLRIILRAHLDMHHFQDVQMFYPPPELCTDNAAMIAWTGMEMYDAGWSTPLSAQAKRKWSIDPEIEGGILASSLYEYRPK